MIRQEYIPLDSPSEWKQALKGIKHSFGHTWENCHAMSLTSGLRTNLYSYSSGDVKVLCPIAEQEYNGHTHILKPFGFSGFIANGDCREFIRHWNEFVDSKGFVCGYLGFNPLFDCSTYFNNDEIVQYNTVHVMDLEPDMNDLWQNLSTNRKRQLRDWDTMALDLVLDKSPLIDFFTANYIDFFARKNAPQFYYFSKETLMYLFNLDNVVLVGAPSRERVESVSVFTYTEDAGEYLFNISLPGCNNHAAALLWYGVTRLKSLHVPILNLGGGSTEFKRRFGCSDLPLKSIRQIYAPGIYRQLCRLADVDPDDRDGYFPPYLKP